MVMTTINVNGSEYSRDIDESALLVEFLRDHLGLTGTHIGCDSNQCGACVVHVDGRAVKSCALLAVQAHERTVVTIEGVAKGPGLHPVQQSFHDCHALQCGFCTPGMVMTAIDMLERHGSDLDRTLIRNELKGNICRCTGYNSIVDAILAVFREKGRSSAWSEV